MRCMYNREEKVQDAVAIVTARFYNNLRFNWADEDSIASFYGPESSLTWGPVGAPDSMLQRIKGRYTVAQHFHDLMNQLGSDITFDVEKKQSASRPAGKGAKPGDEGEVIISHRVIIKDERPAHLRMGDGPDVLGIFDETVSVRLKDVGALVPGVGFIIMAQQLRWVQAPVVRKGSRDHGATPPKCRQQ